MKFLCDNCKAKYQIADEKVTGRTVRMKCRKCSHLIEIRAVSDGQGAPEAAPVEAPAAPAPAAAAPRPAAAAPRPGATRPSTAPAAPRPGGLASAFNKAVASPGGPASERPETDPLDEQGWFAGIGGSPIGPMAGADVRAKIASGDLNSETLVWRDGLDEWAAARTFPELAELIRTLKPSSNKSSSSLQAARGVPRTTPSSPSRGNVIPLHNRAATAEKLEPAEPEAEDQATLYMPNAAAKLRESLSPPAPREAAREKEERAPAAAVIADPFAMSDPFAAPSAPQAPAPMSAPAPAVATAPAFREDPFEEPRPQLMRAAGIPIAGWAAIVLALGAGLAAGALLFKTDPPKPTVQFVTVSAPTPDAPVSVAMVNGTPSPDSVDPSQRDPKTGAVKLGPGGTSKANPKDPKDPKDPKGDKVAPVDLGPSLGDVPSGPSGVGGPGPSGAGPDTSRPAAVDAGAIQRVLNNSKGTLKRACLDAYAAVIKPGSSVSVTISLLINPDGSVGSANVSGGGAVPGLAACVASRAKGWRFPEAQGPTQTSPTLTWVF
ncbi:MAG: GYF domain-containing protein [Polyangiaceae bacterium]